MTVLKKTNRPMVQETKTETIKVLHIIKSLGRGGAEILLPETLRQHDKLQYEFHYIYFLPWKNQVVSEIEKEGGKVICIPAKNNLQIIAKALKIAKYVKENNIKLIHCHLPWAGIVGRLVGRITNIPVIYTEHNKWERYHKATFWMNKLSFPLQKNVIAVSEEVARSIQKFHKGSRPIVSVVQNGADTEKYSTEYQSAIDVRADLSIPKNAPVIGIACVFRAQKRLAIWMEVAARIKKNLPESHFIIVGDGILKSEVTAKMNELNAHSFVHLVGLQSETRPYFKAMDVFMMTSEFEGLPIALLEAMSMKCIPACTAAGGIGEVIKDDQNGILVPVENPYLLVDRLTSLLKGSEDVIQLMKDNSCQTVRNSFSMKKMVKELEVIYMNSIN